jgi:hypothetical protein
MAESVGDWTIVPGPKAPDGAPNVLIAVSLAFTSYAGMDISRDNGLVVDRDYEDKAPYAFTGTVKQVIFDLKPVHREAAKALHEHASVQAVGQGAAG